MPRRVFRAEKCNRSKTLRRGSGAREGEERKGKRAAHLVIVEPELVAASSVTRIEDHVRSGKVDAGLVSSNFAFLAEQPVLIAALVVARVEADGLVHIRLVRGRVKAHLAGRVAAKVAQLWRF